MLKLVVVVFFVVCSNILNIEFYIVYLGDTRSNENIGLTSLHTIFLRLHNKIALLLSKQNSFWSDDIIYHETRRILIGILQHIVYNEFLPLLIGSARSNFGIYHYDSSVKKRKDFFVLIFRMNMSL
jgi:hypothetical protein